ncbi:hypothetical protein [Legionella impletisoli]|uniref:Uncharacterized protein n=1 Tax=Legionella impletisoli TaxID=343510 RepID=A0A917NFD6_9GAMM|nr:hypothetical protein [Legionella impletisoli]GGI92577.1 hypothetical protein GCM10007966_21520 [Legionella impletisoli]
MPGFFRMPAFNAYTSSKTHRNTERSNAFTEIMSLSLKELNPAAVLPCKFAQSLVSGYALCRKDTHFTEKFIHALQLILAGTQAMLAVRMLFTGEECSALESSICKWSLTLSLLYQGTLLTGWLPGELSKDPFYPHGLHDPRETGDEARPKLA